MASRQSFPAFAPERFAPTPERPLRAKARMLEHLADIQPHRHDWAQLVFSMTGAELVTIAASPIAVGDKLVLLDEEGRAAIVQAGPEFEIVGHGKLDDLFWCTPAVAGDALLLRGVDHLYCVRM